MDEQFTWIPIFNELTEKLLKYEEDSITLVKLLSEINCDSLLPDRDYDCFDPFSFFLLLVKNDNPKRMDVLKKAREIFVLDSVVPDDFTGLVDAQSINLSYLDSEDYAENVNVLWSLYKMCINDNINNDTFSRVIDLTDIDLPLLSYCLYCVRPDMFIPIDEAMRTYLSDYQYDLKKNIYESCSYKEYIGIIYRIDELFFEKTYSEIYCDAISWSKKDVDRTKYFIISPGINAKMWPRCKKDGHITVDCSDLNDLSNVNSIKELMSIYSDNKLNTLQSNVAAATTQIWNFINLSRGDIVIVNYGMSNILAIGKVIGNYKYNDNYSSFKHVVPVEWFDLNSYEIPQQNEWWGKSVVEITAGKYHKLNSEKQVQHYAVSDQESWPLCQILFGPSGTGKSYSLIQKAISIVEQDQHLSDDDQLIKKYHDLCKKGQILHLSFHPNYSYSEFVENKSEDGLFKKFAYKALYSLLKSRSILQNEDKLEIYSNVYDELLRVSKDKTIEFTTKSGKSLTLVKVLANDSIELHKEKSTSKYSVSKDRLVNLYQYVLTNSIDIDNEPITFIRKAIGGCDNSIYWAVFISLVQEVEFRILAMSKEQSGEGLSYDEIKDYVIDVLKSGDCVFDIETAPNYVMLIDDMDQVNIRNVFGEIISLLDPDKRFGAEKESLISLPCSKETFRLPSNLYIVGSMTTSNSNISLMEPMVRRRFFFREMLPDSNIIIDNLTKRNVNRDLIDLVVSAFETINKRVSVLLGNEFLIGHTYFLNILNVNDLYKLFYEKLLPTLFNYCSGDWLKLIKIVGRYNQFAKKGFVKVEDSNTIFEEEPSEYDYYSIYKYSIDNDFINALDQTFSHK